MNMAQEERSAMAPRGRIGRLERLPTLDGESYQQFVTAMRGWVNSDLRAAAEKAANAQLARAGVDPGTLDDDELASVLEADPLVATRSRASIFCQQMTWEHMRAELGAAEAERLAELDAYDRSGPGTVSVDPQLQIPDYARHEVHLQPGGYVGDPLAGYLFHFGTNNFYHGQNDQDQFHLSIAERLDPPEGDLRRIVDLGCGVGQLTVAIKQRFPDAEVHGIDVGAPMVRYAHRRAVDLGADVHFHQRLAHDTGFEAASVDLVTAYILFHEVPAQVGREIVAEAFRILRPGGVFEVFDFATPFSATDPYPRYTFWVDHRFNNEPWSAEFTSTDFVATLREAGFAGELIGHHLWGVHRYRGVKAS